MKGKKGKLSLIESGYMKIMYVKCLMRNEYESYLRRNEHYLQCSALPTELTSLKAGLFFTAAWVVFITAKISFIFIS